MIRSVASSRRIAFRVIGGARLVIVTVRSPAAKGAERPPWVDCIGMVEVVVITLRSAVVARREVNGFSVNSVAAG